VPLPIDISEQTFNVTQYPRPLYEFQSPEDRAAGRARQPKIDRQTNQPLYAVQMFISGIGRVVEVRVAGEPKGLAPGMPAKVTGLTINHWQMERAGRVREGVTYREAPATAAYRADTRHSEGGDALRPDPASRRWDGRAGRSQLPPGLHR
jgi:hypothetical protein